jgi:hypothetical protein
MAQLGAKNISLDGSTHDGPPNPWLVKPDLKKDAIRMLLAEEIYRRVEQVEAAMPQVRVMIYGDSFDHQSWGAVPMRYAYGGKDTLMLPGVADLPGLNEEQKEKVKEKLILEIWNPRGWEESLGEPDYSWKWLRPDYNTRETFDRLISKGYKLVYFCFYPKDGTKPWRTRHQAKEFASVSRRYRSDIYGYATTAWSVPPDHSEWDMIEYMYEVADYWTYRQGRDFVPASSSVRGLFTLQAPRKR